MSKQAQVPRSVRVWLWAVFGMVLAMVCVGGITRLTGSGLSMVEWRPLMGALPPLSDAEWAAVFAKYQATPQYGQVNHWMTLADFQRIFFWEYVHRVLGRLIGVVFFVPWAWFLIRRRIGGRVAAKTAVAFFLGGAQGVLGWYMVKSGLVDVPEVSHFRLAAHLGLALLVMQYVMWLAVDFAPRPERQPADSIMTRLSWAFVALVSVQIIYGAFMAGKRAGLLYATFPDMNDQFIPGGMADNDGFWSNALSNPIAIHFIHRVLGWLTLACAGVFFWFGRSRTRSVKQRQALVVVAILTVAQFVLGVLTVVYYVPIWAAVTHQVAGAVLLSAVVYCAYVFSRRNDAATSLKFS